MLEILKSYVQIVADHKFGLQKIPAVINHNQSEWNNPGVKKLYIDLPYGGQYVKLEIIFSSENLSFPPDVIAYENFFDTMPVEIVQEKLPSLKNWCPSNVNCLLQFVIEILDLYKTQQVAMLKKNENLKQYCFQYETLISSIDAADLEVMVQPSVRGATVQFFIALKVDLRDLPVSPIELGSPVAILIVTYRPQAEANATIKILPEVEQLTGFITLPVMHQETVLMDYVPEVKFILDEKVQLVRYEMHQRRTLFCALTSLVEPAILDVDSEFFTKISFMMEKGNRQAICLVDLKTDFPVHHPILTIYKVNQRIMGKKIANYVFDARWSFEKMATQIVSTFLKEAFE